MSQFHFPRINFHGVGRINVGTANNDDYSQFNFATAPTPYSGQPVRTSDTMTVQAMTYGQSEDQFVQWIQHRQNATDPTGKPQQIIPAEWNYYGDMSFGFENVTVQSIQNFQGQLITSGNELIGAKLSFLNDNGINTGILTDCNPEDMPSTQVFANILRLDKAGTTFFKGKPSKAFTRWISIYRNTRLPGDAGSGGYFQCVVPKEEIDAAQFQYLAACLGVDLRTLPNFKGLVCRYTIYKSTRDINMFDYYGNTPAYLDKMEQLYENQEINLSNPSIAGTIAPWFEGEMKSITLGRILQAQGATYSNPDSAGTPPFTGNGASYMLAPIMLKVMGNRISLDIAGTFPEQYDPQTKLNPKANLGAMYLQLNFNGNPITLGQINYQTEPDAPNTIYQGDVCDIDLSYFYNHYPDFAEMLKEGNFQVYSYTFGKALLTEKTYLVASDQGTLYAEQYDTSGLYRSDDPKGEPCYFTVLKKGEPLLQPMQMYVQEILTTPYNDQKLSGNMATFMVGAAPVQMTLNTQNTFNKLYRFAPTKQDLINSMDGFNMFDDYYINLRVLPKVDFSQYLDTNHPDYQPLTYQVLYEKILKNYYLLYPAMNQQLSFREEKNWNNRFAASAMKDRIDLKNWNRAEYMPPTRDMSEGARKLIQTWCDSIINGAMMLLLSFFLFACGQESTQHQTQSESPSTDTTKNAFQSALPFVVTVQQAQNQPAPALQAFAFAEDSGDWLILSGRKNGYHGLFGANSTFPSRLANDSMWVVNLAANKAWGVPIPAQYKYALSATNPAFYQDGNTLYLIGGYGSNCPQDTDNCYQTFPQLTAIQVKETIQAIKTGTSTGLEKYISSLTDERLRVTGGELMNLNGNFYLVMGQNYKGKYTGGNQGNYTNQIAKFNISFQNNKLSIANYQVFTDPRFHRRDLHVMPAIRANGQKGITVYGGVFTEQNNSAWVNPVYINETGGQTVISYEADFSQQVNQYQSAVLLMYSAQSQVMLSTILGGISLYKKVNNQLVIDNNLPFSNLANTLVHYNSGKTFEFVMNDTLPALLGTSGIFIPTRATIKAGNSKEIIDYDQLPRNAKTLVGYIYGGILATAPKSDAYHPTYANRQIYEVYVSR